MAFADVTQMVALKRILRTLEEEARAVGLGETAMLIGAAEMILAEAISDRTAGEPAAAALGG